MTLDGDLDYWENPVDVYRIHLEPGRQLWVRLSARPNRASLQLWKPGTLHVNPTATRLRSQRLAATSQALPIKRLHYTAHTDGWYYLEVALDTPTNAAYTLSYATQ